MEADDQAHEDEVLDLAVITLKSLLRYKRDDLIRLCEARDLETVGTKNELARSLVEWVSDSRLKLALP